MVASSPNLSTFIENGSKGTLFSRNQRSFSPKLSMLQRKRQWKPQIQLLLTTTDDTDEHRLLFLSASPKASHLRIMTWKVSIVLALYFVCAEPLVRRKPIISLIQLKCRALGVIMPNLRHRNAEGSASSRRTLAQLVESKKRFCKSPHALQTIP